MPQLVIKRMLKNTPTSKAKQWQCFSPLERAAPPRSIDALRLSNNYQDGVARAAFPQCINAQGEDHFSQVVLFFYKFHLLLNTEQQRM